MTILFIISLCFVPFVIALDIIMMAIVFDVVVIEGTVIEKIVAIGFMFAAIGLTILVCYLSVQLYMQVAGG